MTHALEAEPYSSNQVRTGALQAVFSSINHVLRVVAACPGPTVTSRRLEKVVRRLRVAIDGALRAWAMDWAD